VDKADGYATRKYEEAWWVWVRVEGGDAMEETMKVGAAGAAGGDAWLSGRLVCTSTADQCCHI
jgi:hypothetical protein